MEEGGRRIRKRDEMMDAGVRVMQCWLEGGCEQAGNAGSLEKLDKVRKRIPHWIDQTLHYTAGQEQKEQHSPNILNVKGLKFI